jgi:hypothetical protein
MVPAKRQAVAQHPIIPAEMAMAVTLTFEISLLALAFVLAWLLLCSMVCVVFILCLLLGWCYLIYYLSNKSGDKI